jgi:hypothetical protein
MDVSKAIVAYTSAGYIQARVLSIDTGTTITVGSEYEEDFSTTTLAGRDVNVAALSSTLAVVVFRHWTGDEEGYVMAISRSGTTLSFGSEVKITAGSNGAGRCDIVALGSTNFVTSFEESSTFRARAGTVSGTTITLGSAVNLSAASADTDCSISRINSTYFIASYSDGSTYLASRVSSVSGSTITLGTQDDAGAGIGLGSEWCVMAVSNSQAVLAREGDSGANYQYQEAHTINFNPVGSLTGNVIVGAGAGASSTGNNSVLIGAAAGENNAEDYRLYIDITNTATPLIYGEFDDDNLGINTVDMAGGKGVIAIANATTVPASTPTGGGVLYVEGGALKYKGSSGTITTLGVA